jgi:lambda family phage minor tail protein L
MSTPIKKNLSVLHSSDGLVDLFILDTSALGGSVYHFSPSSYSDGSLLTWGGQAYNLFPIGIDNYEVKSDGSQLPQVNITVSNVGGGPLLASVIALGDLVGATLTQYTTKVSYLDGQSEPDTSQFIGPNVWRIVQKAQQTNQTIIFVGAFLIDLPGMMFPIRQILIDPSINPPDGIYFPGVSPYRTSQWQAS